MASGLTQEQKNKLKITTYFMKLGEDYYSTFRTRKLIGDYFDFEVATPALIGDKKNYLQESQAKTHKIVEYNRRFSKTKGGKRFVAAGGKSPTNKGRRIYLPIPVVLNKDGNPEFGPGKSLESFVAYNEAKNSKNTKVKSVALNKAFLTFPTEIELPLISSFLFHQKDLLKKVQDVAGANQFKVVGGGWYTILGITDADIKAKLSAEIAEEKAEEQAKNDRKEGTTPLAVDTTPDNE